MEPWTPAFAGVTSKVRLTCQANETHHASGLRSPRMANQTVRPPASGSAAA
jgi:hypothetical protein